MEIKKLLRDSLIYPFSDWKRLLILGIILLVANLDINSLEGIISLSIYNALFGFLVIIEFILGIFVSGYCLKS